MRDARYITITAAIIYPVLTPPHGCGGHRETCASNLKQIGMAAQAYAADYDAMLPPTAGAAPLDKNSNFGPVLARCWLKTVTLTKSEPYGASAASANTQSADGYLQPYLTSSRILRCPTVLAEADNKPLDYMTSDLAGGAKLSGFTTPLVSVLAMDGEAVAFNIGHAYVPVPRNYAPELHFDAEWDFQNNVLFVGKAVRAAAKRYSGGAEYLFADGHVQWMRPHEVFFPPRSLSSPAHLDATTGVIIGPPPGGSRTFHGEKFKATFHLR